MIVVLLSFLTAAVITDVREGRIYNSITYPGILAALGLNALGSLAIQAEWVDATRLGKWGIIGLPQALIGLLVCGLLMVACYVFFRIGGGDVKLIAMMGTFLGPEAGIKAMLWTFVLGACLALVVLVWRVGIVSLVKHVVARLLGWFRLGYWVSLTPDEKAALQPTLFLAPSAWIAVVIVHFEVAERLTATI